ncbi:MAG: hypothetical protein P0107_04555 [Nitrosomonas sp.]|nr:hypothetical protein [Nitrosomonas sp.]
MNSTGNTSNNAHLHWSHVLLIVLATIMLTVAATYWVLTTYVFVSSFEPVVLSEKEEKTLSKKLGRSVTIFHFHHRQQSGMTISKN